MHFLISWFHGTYRNRRLQFPTHRFLNLPGLRLCRQPQYRNCSQWRGHRSCTVVWCQECLRVCRFPGRVWTTILSRQHKLNTSQEWLWNTKFGSVTFWGYFEAHKQNKNFRSWNCLGFLCVKRDFTCETGDSDTNLDVDAFRFYSPYLHSLAFFAFLLAGQETTADTFHFVHNRLFRRLFNASRHV